MYKIILVFFSFVSVAKAADLAKWEPIYFEFPTAVVDQQIQELSQKKDSGLKKLEKLEPGFSQSYGKSVQKFAELALNSVRTPLNLRIEVIQFDRWGTRDSSGRTFEQEALKEISFKVGRYIAKLIHGSFGSAIKAPSPDGYVDNDAASVAIYDWKRAESFVSSSSFVTAVCPVIKPIASWNLKWNYTSTTDKILMRLFFNELDRVLGVMYGDGKWKRQKLPNPGPAFGYEEDSDSMNYSSDLAQFIQRRYVSGGPALMLAARECLSSIRQDLDIDIIGTDPNSTLNIGQMLQFAPTEIPALGKTIDLQSAALDWQMVYRLTRHYGANQALPSPMLDFIPAEGDVDYSSFDNYQFIRAISEVTVFDIHNAKRLLTHLSVMDPQYKYRSVNRDEMVELIKLGKASKAKSYCVIEGTEVEENITNYYVSAAGNVRNEPYAGGCSYSNFIFVRESK
jgi:hypothetical protein